MKELPEPGYYAPIAYDRYHGGYYYTDPGYSISRIRVKEADIDAIEFAARILSQFRDFPIITRYAEAIDRILDVVDVRRLVSQEELEEFVQFETPVYQEGTGFLEPIIRAVKEKQVIRLRYRRFKSTKDDVGSTKDEAGMAGDDVRILHPYLLKEYRNRWYVVGLDGEKGEIRTFGLDRIRAVDVQTNIEYRSTNFEPGAYFRHTIGIIAPQGKPPVIELEFRRQQAQYLLTQPVHATQQVIRETAGTVVFSFEVHPTYEFISFILGFREDVVVVKPAWLREEVRGIAEKMLKLYEKA
jgi:predicted DNA-binding transcriptional regulator YafY